MSVMYIKTLLQYMGRRDVSKITTIASPATYQDRSHLLTHFDLAHIHRSGDKVAGTKWPMVRAWGRKGIKVEYIFSAGTESARLLFAQQHSLSLSLSHTHTHTHTHTQATLLNNQSQPLFAAAEVCTSVKCVNFGNVTKEDIKNFNREGTSCCVFMGRKMIVLYTQLCGCSSWGDAAV